MTFNLTPCYRKRAWSVELTSSLQFDWCPCVLRMNTHSRAVSMLQFHYQSRDNRDTLPPWKRGSKLPLHSPSNTLLWIFFTTELPVYLKEWRSRCNSGKLYCTRELTSATNEVVEFLKLVIHIYLELLWPPMQHANRQTLHVLYKVPSLRLELDVWCFDTMSISRRALK